jgi:hypothetical protein
VRFFVVGGTIALVVLVAAPSAASAGTTFDEVLRKIEGRRNELAQRYRGATDDRARAQIRAEARAFLEATIVSDIFPAWLGTPWGTGANSTACVPHEPGKVVGCSYFLTAVLQNAGLRLESRARFAQAPSLWIQRALLPPAAHVVRFGSLPAPELRRRIAALGDGLYVVGLNYHVGFLVVRGDAVDVVHANYDVANPVVVREPLETSFVIAASRDAGYFVSPLFRDDRILELWLTGEPVPAPARWQGRRTTER